MSEEVDELFGRGGGAPAPRAALAIGLMVLGLLLAVVGIGCTSVPGGIVALLGWFVVEQDHDRLEAGYLPTDSAGTVRVLRIVGGVVVLLIISLVMTQLWLMSRTDLYDGLWTEVLDWVASIREPASAPAPDPSLVPAPGPAPAPAPAP